MFLRAVGFILVSILGGGSAVWAAEPAFAHLRADELKNGYGIRLIRPIPRHDNGCSTVFRNGKVLKSCDGNFGFDPANYGGIMTFCRWDLNTVDHGSRKTWAEPYFTSGVIPITEAEDVWNVRDDYQTIYSRIRSQETIHDRHIRIRFASSDLGELVCYAGYLNSYRKNADDYFGAKSFVSGVTQPDDVRSGLSIGDVLDELHRYLEIVPL